MLLKEKNNPAKEKSQDYKLIDGTFMPADANRFLMQLINSKIDYHNLEILSMRERFNGDVSHSLKRIEELKETQEALRQLLNIAFDNEMEVRVHCSVQIELVK
ncbi:MAG: hypothetical protein KF725_13365 [Cyclobacteriaceae bacterium]|nr:hypothetical protein [Cyclobacteriaceae bacterium]UYN85389.1 MAG: hypothetical protein KIT51_10850 [Cyclobacteriaceae bacterium]